MVLGMVVVEIRWFGMEGSEGSFSERSGVDNWRSAGLAWATVRL